ncbi:MAG: ThiF family adenylyltransferase [Syntrophobacteraceae bacterium]
MDYPEGPLTAEDHSRYQRNIQLEGFGPEGQRKLRASRVLVIGLGGLGSPVLLYLAAAGIGTIGIVEEDPVDLSNLQRQLLYGEEDVGRSKIRSAADRIRRSYANVGLVLHEGRLTEQNGVEIISAYDFVIDATDNFESKFLVNDLCVRLGKPFSHAAVSGYYGQAMTVVPGTGPCYRCIFGEVPPEDAVRGPDEEGTLGTVPGVLGAVQATEAIKYLTGIGCLLIGRLFTWDALTSSAREVTLPAEPSCPVCRTG